VAPTVAGQTLAMVHISGIQEVMAHHLMVLDHLQTIPCRTHWL